MSGIEQHDAIMRTAEACGFSFTIVRPTEKRWTEPQKRDHCWRLLALDAEPFVDWVTIIDADEVIAKGHPSFRETLAGQPEDVHCHAARLHTRIDPAATEPYPHNTEKTPEIHRALDIPHEYPSAQSRFWRCLPDMRVGVTHHSFTALNADGERINIRPDIRAPDVADLPRTDVARSDDEPVFDHREAFRTAARRRTKTDYYKRRDALGLEGDPAA